MNLCGKCKHYQTSLCRRPFYGRNTLAPQGCFEAKKMTNYEKIKNMSIDEMAKKLAEETKFCVFVGCPEADSKITTEDCRKCIKNWLESEVEK